MELNIDRLSKQYKNKIAVDRVSLKLGKGVHGLLGANGAGKTTLMRMICGILKPTSGTVSFDGIDVSEENYRAVLGYLPQDFGYYPEFTGLDFLLYMAALKGLSKPQAKRRAAELLKLVSLQDVTKKKIKTYSGGMKQRLGIAQALLNEPRLLVLDEPTAGLDPKERVRFRNLIEELGKNSIVLLSTHIVSDIEHIADDILMMKDGQLIYHGKWDENKGDLEAFYLQQFDGEDENELQMDKVYQEALAGRKIDQTLLEEMSDAYRKIPLTAERYSDTEEYQKYARPYSEIFNFVRSTTHMTSSEAIAWIPDEHDLYAHRQAMLEKYWEDSLLSESEKNYWRQKEAEIAKPFTYQITESAFSLFRTTSTSGVLLLLLVAICLSSVFVEEHVRRTDQLILRTAHGKSVAYLAKVLAGASYGAGASILLFLTSALLSVLIYGSEGVDAAFQLIFADCSYPLTTGQAMLIILGVLLVTSVLVSVFVMVLSELLHNSIATLAITFGIVIFSMLYSVPAQYRVLSQLWDWLPGSILTPWNIFDIRLLPVFGHYFTAWQAVPVIYTLAGIVIVLIGKQIYRRYQVSGR